MVGIPQKTWGEGREERGEPSHIVEASENCHWLGVERGKWHSTGSLPKREGGDNPKRAELDCVWRVCLCVWYFFQRVREMRKAFGAGAVCLVLRCFFMGANQEAYDGCADLCGGVESDARAQREKELLVDAQELLQRHACEVVDNRNQRGTEAVSLCECVCVLQTTWSL